MKIIVFNGVLKHGHKDKIKAAAERVNADICFVESDDDIPDNFRNADVVYGFGMNTADTRIILLS